MATPIYAPRVNNNDDEVKVIAFEVAVGDQVAADQVIGQVETDKAVLDVTAPAAGYVIGIVAEPETTIRVGSILLWLGATRDETAPQAAAAPAATQTSMVTGKARLLLEQNRLRAEAIPPIDGRVTVEAVERYLAANAGARTSAATPAAAPEGLPEVEGKPVPLTREEKGMAATVTWHRDFAVPGYIEIEYELAPWAEQARQFQEENRLLMPPLLPLMAWRLVEIAAETPRLNATISGDRRIEFNAVNLGFTIQVGAALYLAVVRNAGQLDRIGFVNSLGDILRRASAHNLREPEAGGATIGFSSMERWKVTRHIPILPPHTALMVAHAAGRDGRGVLGASYDHRVLNGGQVVAALKKLSSPNNN